MSVFILLSSFYECFILGVCVGGGGGGYLDIVWVGCAAETLNTPYSYNI